MKRTLMFIVAGVLGTGIASAQPSDAFPASYGAEGFPALRVWKVLADGHAQECGVNERDLITEIDGIAVDALGGMESLTSWIKEMPPGTVEVTYLRPSVRVGEFTNGSAICAVPGLDIQFMPIFLAGNIPPGSDAEDLGILPGDYINSQPTAPWVHVWRRNDRWGEPGERYMTAHRLTPP